MLNSMMRNSYFLTFSFLLLCPGFVIAQPGKDGARTVGSVVVNSYTNLTANASAGATSISVGSNDLSIASLTLGALASGDLILIIQMQGAAIDVTNTSSYGTITNYNNTGRHEFVCVSGVSGSNIINLSTPLAYSYTSAGKVQVVRVPRLTSFTVSNNQSVTATAWNGTTGGIVAIETTGAIDLGNNSTSITVNGQGFRGGVYADNSGAIPGNTNFVSTDANLGAQKGESIAGSSTDYAANGGSFNRGAPANGGGGGNLHNAGGGGGANGNNGVAYTGLGNPITGFAAAWNLESASFATSTSSGGGRGGYSYGANNADASTQAPGDAAWGGDNRLNVGGRGGRPLDYTAGRIFLGGGGGAGDGNNATGGSGGRGGGMVFLIAGGNITGNGSINANGNAGVSTTGGDNDAPGGGGGGGTVIIYQRVAAGTIAANVDINANGGVGGNQSISGDESEGPGGGGGGGYIAIRSSSSPTITIAGGVNGITSSNATTEFPPNGATRGAAGLSTTYTPNPSLFVTIKGTVFADGNGGTINGTGTNISGALYISAVQSGTVIGTAAVAADGTFTINALPITATASSCDLVLHNNPAGQNSAALPANYVHTAEGTTVAGDGTINGQVLSLSSNCAAILGVVYGINKRPVTDPYTGQGWTNPGGTIRVNVPTEAFDGSDEEDGVYANNLNGRTVTLFPATNATLWYFNGTTFIQITASTVITNFNNDNVFVDPTAASGPATVSFQYLVRDDAGFDAPTPATVTMGFSVLLPAVGLHLDASSSTTQGVLATWTTLTEQNTANFSIQYSTNGIQYKTLKVLPAAGNSQSKKSYEALLNNLPIGLAYLRVMLTDKDGKQSFSNTVLIDARGKSVITALPNPSKGKLTLQGINNSQQIRLIDVNGREMKRWQVNAPSMLIDLSAYAKGIYMLQVLEKDGNLQILKIMRD